MTTTTNEPTTTTETNMTTSDRGEREWMGEENRDKFFAILGTCKYWLGQTFEYKKLARDKENPEAFRDEKYNAIKKSLSAQMNATKNSRDGNSVLMMKFIGAGTMDDGFTLYEKATNPIATIRVDFYEGDIQGFHIFTESTF